MLPEGTTGVTSADGLASLALPGVAERGDQMRYLAVGPPGDQAILTEGRGGLVSLTRQRTQTELLWYGITDRNLYRPGEEVRFKGWVRRFERARTGGLSSAGAGSGVTWRAQDPQGNEIGKGTARLTEFGGFDGVFTVPAGANLGGAYIVVRLDGTEGEHPIEFQVQEFRRPEFEVAAQADPGPHVVGGSAEVSVRASYFSGGALPGAEVSWRVQSQPATYTPPGWAEWRFGMQDGGWWSWRPRPPPQEETRTLQGETDVQGRHAIRLDLDRAVPPRAYTLEASATIVDVNRQPWTSSAQLLVHPAEVYVGLRTERTWQTRGEPIRVEGVVVDLDGKPVAGRPVRLRAERLSWVRRGGGWEEVAGDTLTCGFVSELNPRACTFATPEGGRYRLVADVSDERGRPSRTEVTVWVSGGAPLEQPGQRMGAGEQVRLLPDRERYAPGDTARILVQLPFWPARGLMTVRRNGIVRTDTIQSDSSTLTLAVPITEADIPNTHVQVDVVGASDTIPGSRGMDFASGAATLSVPPTGRSLSIVPLAADSVAVPDAPTSVTVQVKDAQGRPVRDAEVALAVVDEAVLALTGYRFHDPLELFHPRAAPGVMDAWLHPSVLKRGSGDGVVSGRVRDVAGQPVAGAMVTVEGTELRVATDAAGAFRLVGVPRGARTIVATRIGLGSASRGVVVGPDPVQVDIVMESQGLMLESIVATGFSAEGGVLQARVAGVQIRGSSTLGPPPPAMAAPPPPPPAPGAPQPAIAIRTNFNPLAVWTPVVRTDAEGRATVPFTLPSSLTRYRVMAVAAQGLARFGAGESAITVRQPLMVRPSAPRFLNFGDRFEFAVVIQNQTGQAMTVDVAARAEGITFREPGRRVTVPANDRVEVRIPGEAVRAGTAHVQVAAVSGARSDAAFVTLPVYTPATAEAFATYGNFTEGAATLPLQIADEDVLPGFGGLEVSTSSTALHELTDAFLYLVKYPYQGSEQIASRLLAVAALRDVLTGFRAEGLPPAQELADSVARD
ncbi:MAG TPA: alpha-2-macroglobulin family protein, partial [Longimicrobium sp.]|nr:alpha-2-macroglobulin family protein [Longimicrobium sp.]